MKGQVDTAWLLLLGDMSQIAHQLARDDFKPTENHGRALGFPSVPAVRNGAAWVVVMVASARAFILSLTTRYGASGVGRHQYQPTYYEVSKPFLCSENAAG